MITSSLLLLAKALSAIANPAADPFDPGPNPLLMKHPTMNTSSIVFEFAGDLWIVPRKGGEARRLTTHPGTEMNPFFSPDGKTVVFSAQYDGNIDVYTVPATGGVPKRITYHPAADEALGWAPDGKSIFFSSNMISATVMPRMFKISANGGLPAPLPFPSGSQVSMSPDQSQIAYVPTIKWQKAWKRYRGGQAFALWIGNMSDSKVTEVPRKGWNTENPMWVGDRVYFLQDPKGPVELASYDVKTKRVRTEVEGSGFDIKSATAGPGGIVYEKLGSLHIFDPETRTTTRVPVSISGDFPGVRPAFKSLSGNLTGSNISPSGQRAVMTARGWVVTVPAAKGNPRLLDEKQGVHRRDPAWSPDGKTVSYITDEGGRQRLALHDVTTGITKLADLGESPAYYYAAGPACWSPDSTKLAIYDNRNKLWIHEVATGKNTLVDQTLYTDPNVNLAVKWSPDSKWMTYARDLESHVQAVFLYDVEAGKKTQITDGLAHARSPIFDRDGKHLYFFASTNAGPALSWLDMSSLTNPVILSSVYCVVLRKDLPNPLQPESDEEVPKTPPPAAGGASPASPASTLAGGDAKPTPPKPSIDLDGIESRIIPLPMPVAEYTALEPATAGGFFAMAAMPRANPIAPSPMMSVTKWSMSERRATPFGNAMSIVTTPDGTKALVNSNAIVSTMAPFAPGSGTLEAMSQMQVKIDPKAEWRSIFNEIWNNEPILFYAANLHGISAETMRKRYEPFLENVASRSDLNYLFTDMLGEMAIGHMWASGGDIPRVSGVPGGLLGADYEFANGRYRITRIFDGERWNPGLSGPLAKPGINAKVGEYVLAIDGKELKDSNDIYEALEARAGRQVKVKLGPNPDGSDSREVTVIPVASETSLRNLAWVEDNRRYVDKMTGGRAGYVHVPDTGGGGWTAFLRYYYAQAHKDGILIDERYNQGGLITDYIIYEMSKTLDAAFTPRDGRDWPTPGSTVYGPKVMLANEMAGSGGDMFPWLFKHKKLGPVIGKRTWGGLVASFGFPTVDGGNINSPNCAFYNPASKKWEVEGYGVDPDIEVELDPYMWRQGKDSQLEAAIKEINARLANYKRPELKRPANPDKSKVGN